MKRQGIIAGSGLVALGAALFAFAPAFGASEISASFRPTVAAMRGGVGYFTPSAADPRLAAIFARGGLTNQGFRFTRVAVEKNRAITVAVRSSRTLPALTIDRAAQQPVSVAAAPTLADGVAPVSYSLGAAVGWKRFALAGQAARTERGLVVPSVDKAETGISPARKWNTRLQLAAERPVGQVPGTLTGSQNYSVDVGGSFRLTRNLDVTAGVRYRSERDRLQQRIDDRRDSQALYVGTAIRF
jgi:hypothetical protein